MDANRKKIVVVGGALVVALVLVLFVVLFFLGGEPEPRPVAVTPPPPVEAPPPKAEEPKPEAKPQRLASYTVKKGATMEDIAARPDIYGKGDDWWVLWQANPDAVSHAFQTEGGKWVAIVRAGKTLKVPEPKALSQMDKNSLTAAVQPYAVQFASFPSAGEANRLLASLSASGAADFYVTPRYVDGVNYHRVRAGFFRNWNEAERFGATFTQSNSAADDYYVTEPRPEEVRDQNAALLRKYKGGE
ncbi:MAG: SPOR domain-containing protein [Deltaproteobacteria bacterium]|nr:SPOR domain-containing protein [Deltaproteobacteria bacterium]